MPKPVDSDLLAAIAEFLSNMDIGGGGVPEIEELPSEDSFSVSDNGEEESWEAPEGMDTSEGTMEWDSGSEPYFDSLRGPGGLDLSGTKAPLEQAEDSAPGGLDIGEGSLESTSGLEPDVGEGSLESPPLEGGRFSMESLPGAEIGPDDGSVPAQEEFPAEDTSVPTGPQGSEFPDNRPSNPQEIIQKIIELFKGGSPEVADSLAAMLAKRANIVNESGPDEVPEGS